MSPQLSFRPITDADQELLFQIFASTRTDELANVPWSESQKAEFLRMQFRAQHSHYQQHFTDARFEILILEEQPVGRLYVHRTPAEINLIDIALMPEHRGTGIGTFLLRELISEARASKIPLRLYVEIYNPAYRLYTRLGFRQIADTGVYHQLEWSETTTV